MNNNWQEDKAAARDFVERQAARHGLSAECLEAYDIYTRNASTGNDRLWFFEQANDALYDWDI